MSRDSPLVEITVADSSDRSLAVLRRYSAFTEDPDAAVESIARSAKGLVEQGTAAAPDSTASCSGQKASDEDIAAKLALVFEDEVTCAETVAAQACTQSEGEQPTPPYSDTSAAGVDPLGDLDPTGTETPAKSVEESEPPYEQEPLTIGKNEEEFVKVFLEEAA